MGELVNQRQQCHCFSICVKTKFKFIVEIIISIFFIKHTLSSEVKFIGETSILGCEIGIPDLDKFNDW